MAKKGYDHMFCKGFTRKILMPFVEMMFTHVLPEYEKTVLKEYNDDDADKFVFMDPTDTELKPILDEIVGLTRCSHLSEGVLFEERQRRTGG